MPDPASTYELDIQIAVARRSIAELMERATATSGSAAEEAITTRINELQDRLNELLLEREARGET